MISMINLEIVTDALEFAFNASESKWVCDQKITPAIAICEAALAEQSEPVARVMYDDDGIKTNNLIDCDLPVGTLLFTHPASKPEPLTDEEILLAISPFYKDTLTRRAAIEVSIDEYRAIEQAVWEKLK